MEMGVPRSWGLSVHSHQSGCSGDDWSCEECSHLKTSLTVAMPRAGPDEAKTPAKKRRMMRAGILHMRSVRQRLSAPGRQSPATNLGATMQAALSKAYGTVDEM
jgi:hypothetical protein